MFERQNLNPRRMDVFLHLAASADERGRQTESVQWPFVDAHDSP